jgi:hypothetical protein
VLNGEAAAIDDVTFFGLGGGVPVTPWDWSFDLTEQQAERMLTGLSPGAVLLVHSPSQGHVDGGFGSAAVLRAIQQRRPPTLLCGHVYECWGQQSRVGDVPVRNLGRGGAVIDLDAGASRAPACAIAVAAQAGQAYRSPPAISRSEGVFMPTAQQSRARHGRRSPQPQPEPPAWSAVLQPSQQRAAARHAAAEHQLTVRAGWETSPAAE